MIRSCDTTLAAKGKEIGLCNLGLSQTTDKAAQLSSQLEAANKKLESPFRNPWIMGMAGALVGLIVMGRAK